MKVQLLENNSFSEEETKIFKEMGIKVCNVFTTISDEQFKDIFIKANGWIAVHCDRDNNNIFVLAHPYDI